MMMGVTLSGPIFVYGENMYVLHNTQRPDSVLKKKSNSICYHGEHKYTTMGESIIVHVPSVDNPAEICATFLQGGQMRNHLIRLLLHDLCDWFVCLIILLAEEACGSWGLLNSRSPNRARAHTHRHARAL
jgi:hypothetical protein